MRQPSLWAGVHSTGLRLALGTAIFALLLLPLRRCDSLVAVSPSMWDVILRPDVGVALAVSAFLLGFPLSLFRGFREKVPSPAYGATLTAIMIVVLIIFYYTVSSSLVVSSLGDFEQSNEPVVVSRKRIGLPTPHTIGGAEAFWRTVRQVQLMRAVGYGYPTAYGEPYSTMYAELAQSSLGAGDLIGAKTWSARLTSIAPESTLAMLLSAKTAYAMGELDEAITLVQRARDCAEKAPASDIEIEMLKRWVDATEAYYAAASFARQGAYDDTASSLHEYARISFDPYALNRVESDSAFERFVGTEEFEALARVLRDVPVIDRNP